MFPLADVTRRYFNNENRQTVRLTIGEVTNDSAIAGVAVAGATTVGKTSYVVLTEADIASGSFILDRAIASGNNISIGECIATELDFTLYNEDGRFNNFDFNGKEIRAILGVVDDDGNDGGEFILGYFYIDQIPKIRSQIKISALDRMVFFDKLVDKDAFDLYVVGRTIANVVAYCCIKCNVMLGTDLTGMPNADTEISSPPDEEGLTYRNLLQYCVGMMGANAFIDWNNELIIKSPKRLVRNPNNAVVDMAIVGRSSTLYEAIVDIDNESGSVVWDEDDICEEILPEDRFSFEYEDYEVAVTGITYTEDNVTYLFGKEGYLLDVTDNPLIQDMYHNCNAIASAIANVNYVPMSAETIPYPYLYPGDWVVSIVHSSQGGSQLRFHYLTNVTFHLNGHTTLASIGKSPQENSYSAISGVTAGTKQYTKAASTRLENLISLNADAIAEQAKQIALKVDSGSVVNAINLSEEGVQIDATKLNVNGIISANGNFRVNKDGTIEANNGIFRGSLESANANITGGSINIVTSTETSDAITLRYGTSSSSMTPTGFATTGKMTCNVGEVGKLATLSYEELGTF